MLLSGEAGIGKSRLTAALLERLAGEPHTRLRYFCSPQHTDSALYPSSVRWNAPLGLFTTTPRETRLGKLDAVLAQTSTATEDAALFAKLLSLPNDGRYPTHESEPRAAPAENAVRARFAVEALSRQSRSDDLRGCTLDRPHEPRNVRSGR